MPAPLRPVTVTMPVVGVEPCGARADWVCCLGCDQPLGLTQPEAEEPSRLVGTCGECGRWYLLDWHPGSGEGLMLLLPTHEGLLDAAGGRAG
jgi:hypothetical protein